MGEARRILLVRLDGLGDALACVPALEGLRRSDPDARFGVVCSDANAALFSRKRMDAVHVYDGAASEADVAAELRRAGYSDAMIATEEPVGYRLARESGAGRRAGFWHRFEKTFKSIWQFTQLTNAVYRPAAWVSRPEHEVDALYRLARALGARLPIPEDAPALRAWLDVSDAAPRVGADTFAFQISSRFTRNGWGPAATAGFASAAIERSPLPRCALLAGPHDEGLARAVMEQLPSGLVASGRAIFVPPAGMSSWLASIAAAGALVTPDTGAAHAAGILGVPVVDIFDPERFDQLSRQWRPWAAPSRCIVKPHFQTGEDVALGAKAADALRALLGPTASA
jgi:ADP-heptose:LPS heptosyltransferase